jgi:hypothetical protein
MFAASCQPTTIRLNTSITNAKNNTPSQQRRYVKSQTHNSFGRAAVKSRSTRSGRRVAAKSRRVVRHGRPRRFAPRIPASRISRCTWQRGTCSPLRNSAFHKRR